MTQSDGLSDSIQHFLVDAIDSKAGIYQFVSERAHRNSRAQLGTIIEKQSRETPILVELGKAWQAHETKPEGLVLGGRYRVVKLVHSANASHGVDNDHTTSILEVVDLKHDPVGNNIIRVPLTQVGLPFKGALLAQEHIERADTIFKAHAGCAARLNEPNAGQGSRTTPTIISFGGIGRNATLIVYRVVRAQIADGKISNLDELDTALARAIVTGRAQRGPGFLHSEAQLGALRASLESAWNRAQHDAAGTQVPNPPAVEAIPAPAPASVLTSTQQQVVHFFQNTGATRSDALTLQKVLAFSAEQIENNHQFIQRLFPIDSYSKFNPDAPIVSGKDVLALRHNQNVMDGLDKGFRTMLGFYGLRWDGTKVSKNANEEVKHRRWQQSNSHHDLRFSRIIRSMSLFGKQAEARALFAFLEQHTARGADKLKYWKNALSDPIQVSEPADRYDVILFPEKALPVSQLDLPDNARNKIALFEKQSTLYHAVDRDNSAPQVPLQAYFTKKPRIDFYANREHLNEAVKAPSPCKFTSSPDFYFTRPDANPDLQRPVIDPSVYEVHVDFANACLGGSWKEENCFAQEEVAFIENVGLGTVAQKAQADSWPLPDATNKSAPHPLYGKTFLTRKDDKTPRPIIVEGCERVGHLNAYGGAAARLGRGVADQLLSAPPSFVNWLAVAAPNYRRERFIQESRGATERAWKTASPATRTEAFFDIFCTAHAGFTMSKECAGNRNLKLHTGQLGCGVFKNSLTLATAAQLLAAKIVGVGDIVFHDFNAENAAKLARIDVLVSTHMQQAEQRGDNVRQLVDTVLNDPEFINEIDRTAAS